MKQMMREDEQETHYQQHGSGSYQ